MTFDSLGLKPQILSALKEQGYTQPTPIQAQSIPVLLDGFDLLGTAQTGTGKTAAFTIPIIEHLLEAPNERKRSIKALVVTPTRELALQVAENAKRYSSGTSLRTAVIFGGVGANPQIDQLKRGVDILVATPGRLLDLQGQGFVDLRNLTHFVLDEADQMLDMGFIHDVKKIIAKLPLKRQSLFFSATMPKSIVDLSQKMLGNFKRITIKPQQATAEKVEQGVYFVSKNNKPKLLIHLIEGRSTDSVLVFSRTKHGANKIVKVLDKANIKSAAIHGNKSQLQRQKALGAFKDGSLKVLIATDIAARGIDVDDLALVINYDLPNVSETYVHRIGRTGRASASGIALSFCMGDERPYLKDIENLIKQQVPRMGEHPFMEGADVVEGSLSKKPQARNKNHNKSINTRNKNRNWR